MTVTLFANTRGVQTVCRLTQLTS